MTDYLFGDLPAPVPAPPRPRGRIISASQARVGDRIILSYHKVSVIQALTLEDNGDLTIYWGGKDKSVPLSPHHLLNREI